MTAISYYLVYGLMWLTGLLPFFILYGISDFLYLIIYHIIGYRKKIVFTNLRKSFPEKSEQEIETIAKGFYKHLCDSIIEGVAILHISAKQINKRFKYKNSSVLDKYIKQQRSVIVVSGHYNNWEWIINFNLFHKHGMLAIYKPQSNKYFDNLLIKMRTRFGIGVVPMKQTLRTILKYKSEKKIIAVYFLTDQAPFGNDVQYWTNFLNQDTPVYLGVEKIGKKLDLPVIFLDIQKVKRGHYVTELIELCEKPKDTKQYEITEMHTKLLESIIKKTPQYWLWSHRRWKRKRETKN